MNTALVSSRPRAVRLVAAMVFALLLAATTYALAASNTVPDGKAGAGAGQISGYNVSGVHYSLNAADPNAIDSVEFVLDTPATGATVQVQLQSASGTWFACSAMDVTVTCPVNGAVSVSQADQLTVVATD